MTILWFRHGSLPDGSPHLLAAEEGSGLHEHLVKAGAQQVDEPGAVKPRSKRASAKANDDQDETLE